MGCGTSAQVHDVNSPTPIDTKAMKFENKQQSGSLSDSKCYLFGQTSGERKVVQYNGPKQYFTTLSSRIRIPRPKLRLQPIQILYQQSQQVILPDLMKKEHNPPFNLMFGVFCRKEVIFLCGGLSYEGDHVYSQAYYYNLNPNSNTQKPKSTIVSSSTIANNRTYVKFQQTTSMFCKRYSHMGIYYIDNQNKRQYVYIFGGKNSQHEPTSACQRYDLATRKWQDISEMHTARAEGCSMLFMDNIYVFGGISQFRLYPQNIEVYNIKSDSWSILNIRLHRGIRSCGLLSDKPNEILILGGITLTQNQQQKLSSIIRVNLISETYSWQTNLPQKMSNLKYLHEKQEERLSVFSNENNIVYSYGFREKAWKTVGNGYKNYIPVGDMRGFVVVGEGIQLRYENRREEVGKFFGKNQFQKFFILGNENYPCIFRIQPNLTNKNYSLKTQQLSMKLHLKSNMNIVHTPEGYFICGGCDINNKIAYNEAFIYNPTAQISKSVDEQISTDQGRSSCGISYHNNSIHLFGGYKNKKTTLKSCQKYDIKQQKWSINYKSMIKCLTNLKTHKLSYQPDFLLLYGGYQQNSGFSTLFQIYDSTINDIISYSQFPAISQNRPSIIHITSLTEHQIKTLKIQQAQYMLEIAQFYSSKSSIQKQQIDENNYMSTKSMMPSHSNQMLKKDDNKMTFKNLVIENIPVKYRNTGSQVQMESMMKKEKKIRPEGQIEGEKEVKNQVIKLKTQEVYIKPIQNAHNVDLGLQPKLEHTQNSEYSNKTPVTPLIKDNFTQDIHDNETKKLSKQLKQQFIPQDEQAQLQLLPLHQDPNIQPMKDQQHNNNYNQKQQPQKQKAQQNSDLSLLTAEKNKDGVFLIHRNSMIREYEILKVYVYGVENQQQSTLNKSHHITTINIYHLLIHKKQHRIHLIKLPENRPIRLSQPVIYTHSFKLPTQDPQNNCHYFINLCTTQGSNMIDICKVNCEDGRVENIGVEVQEGLGRVGFQFGGSTVAEEYF